MSINLETTLDPRLWEAVRASLEARKFTAGILDGIHFLTDVIRERSGVEGDGIALVGAAFGGSSPKLKVNRLRTETEQNIQRGTEQMLRGLYQAIRNPRSHEAYEDSESDAGALILFIDYLLRIVDKSGSPFSLATLVSRILDPDFAPRDRYAELLVAEIPGKKLLATCREVFARRAEADHAKVRFFFGVAISRMSAEENSELCSILSQELRETNDDATIRFVLAAFPSAIWPKLDEIARLRMEHKLLASVKEGKWVGRQQRCTAGALGTWTAHIIRAFTLSGELWQVLFSKLGSIDATSQDYVFKYFAPSIENCFEAPPASLCFQVKRGLKAGDCRFKTLAESWRYDPTRVERDPSHPWRSQFIGELSQFVEKPETPDDFSSADDIPF
jgi:uncharacterized protein (TIGR02391 family)